MNIMETDGRESSLQLVSSSSLHVVDVKRQSIYDYVIYLFLFHITLDDSIFCGRTKSIILEFKVK